MRLIAELLDEVADGDPRLGKAGFLLLAEQMATQALALAAHENHKVTAATADVWIAKAAGASGIADRMIPGTDVRIVGRARQRRLGILSASAD